MTAHDEQTGTVWLVGPGHMHPIPSMAVWDRLRFVGVPHAGSMVGLKIVAWALDFGWQAPMAAQARQAEMATVFTATVAESKARQDIDVELLAA